MIGHGLWRGGAARRLRSAVAPVAIAAALAAGCGPRDPDPATQPAPDVTTFEQGRFDDLPTFPRSEPLGPRTEEAGVISRSYRASGASPEQVLEYYRDTLNDRWQMVTEIERLGAGTFRADWVSEDHRLRVSATGEELLQDDDDAAADRAVSQYSLNLRPL